MCKKTEWEARKTAYFRKTEIVVRPAIGRQVCDLLTFIGLEQIPLYVNDNLRAQERDNTILEPAPQFDFGPPVLEPKLKISPCFSHDGYLSTEMVENHSVSNVHDVGYRLKKKPKRQAAASVLSSHFFTSLQLAEQIFFFLLSPHQCPASPSYGIPITALERAI